ncbi:hypothetical protein [Pseudoalteromonas xiamenensis]|uniref:Uncharacterized protein n=1 Tax=Pseudoalteromonas xiamenensis TaxID=882626 RepID=A0A975DIV3_9GAMM|nr:hypothetical protein [Pseudoalteromonas xiamenensis]QTH72588.1 hypothetical protein J5O05_07250 [Pseudoalteromonas xiamenensis]
MFKKSLLALALSATAFGAAASTIEAVNVTTAEVTTTGSEALAAFTSYKSTGTGTPARAAVFSKEGLALAGDKITVNGVSAVNTFGISFKAGAKYPNGSAVTFLVTGAEFDTSSTVTHSLDAAADTTTGVTAAQAQAKDMTFLSKAADKLVFQVADGVDEDAVTYLLRTGLTKITGDVTITAYASTPVVTEIDKTSFKVATVKNQFKITPTKASGVINVSADRKSFADTVAATGVSAKADFSVKVETDNTPDVLAAVADSVTVTLNNDLSVFDTDADGAFDDGVKVVATDATNTTFTYDKTKKTSVIATKTAGNTAFSRDYGLDIDLTSNGTAVTNGIVLAPTTFSGKVEAKYTGSSKSETLTADVALGAWTLNGSVVKVPYMPFGDNTAVVLRLTNTSSKTGDLTVRYMLEDGVSEWKSVGVVASIKPGLTNISDLVMNAIKADAKVTKGKVAIELTTNVPSSDVTITALFRDIKEQDRAVVGTN